MTKEGIYFLEEFRKEDGSQMSNFDRFMEAIIPEIDVRQHTLADLVAVFQEASMKGLKVELQDDQDLNRRRMCIFHPTLSSMFFPLNNEGKRHDIIEFHDKAPPYSRLPMSLRMQEQLRHILPRSYQGKHGASESSSSDSANSEGDGFSEHSYSKRQDGQTLEEKISACSWFAVLWTCQREVLVRDSAETPSSFDAHLNNLQFWVLYKFNFDQKRRCKYSDLGVVGLLTDKLDKETYWLTPSADCGNALQGRLLDEIYDENMLLLSDMQEKAIRFMTMEQQAGSSSDFSFLMKNQSCS